MTRVPPELPAQGRFHPVASAIARPGGLEPSRGAGPGNDDGARSGGGVVDIRRS